MPDHVPPTEAELERRLLTLTDTYCACEACVSERRLIHEIRRLRALCGGAELHLWSASVIADAKMRLRLARAAKGEI